VKIGSELSWKLILFKVFFCFVFRVSFWVCGKSLTGCVLHSLKMAKRTLPKEVCVLCFTSLGSRVEFGVTEIFPQARISVGVGARKLLLFSL
jgi:hypothetical protein